MLNSHPAICNRLRDLSKSLISFLGSQGKFSFVIQQQPHMTPCEELLHTILQTNSPLVVETQSFINTILSLALSHAHALWWQLTVEVYVRCFCDVMSQMIPWVFWPWLSTLNPEQLSLWWELRKIENEHSPFKCLPCFPKFFSSSNDLCLILSDFSLSMKILTLKNIWYATTWKEIFFNWKSVSYF